MSTNAILFDQTLCIGCKACEQACQAEHDQPAHTATQLDQDSYTWVEDLGDDRYTRHLCMSCKHPTCVSVCPVAALVKHEEGPVTWDAARCIGCRYCMMACPYKARSFIHQNVEQQTLRSPRGKGCVESCNLCVHRIDAGATTTACQDACDKDGHQAILFGDLRDPESALSKALREKSSRQIRADLELNTGVRYTSL